MEEDDLRHPANLNLLTNELKSLKKRLYSCELKGIELREKAMRHFCTNPQSPMALLLSSAGVPGASQASSASSDIDYTTAFTVDTPLPLHNEYLLEQIASHLPMPELRNMRLVCRLWGKEFFRAIASRKPLLVSDDEIDIAKAHALIRKRTAEGVHNNVHISTLILLETPLRTSPILSSLVFHFGDTISGLKVDDCYPSGQDLYELVGKLPCLESLCLKSTIRRVEDVQVDGGELSRVSVLDTFLNAKPELRHPVLKKLYWEDLKAIKSIAKLPDAFPSLATVKLDKVWFQIVAIEEDQSRKTWHSLKDLKMTFNPRGEVNPQQMESPMKTLADRIHFPALTKLCLINLKSCERHEFVKLAKLLKSIRQTLVELELVMTLGLDSSVKTLPPINIFPSEEGGFPRLQSLTCDATLLHSVKILQQSLCPSLVQVNFSPCNDFLYWWKVLKSYSVSHSTVNTNVKTALLGSIDAECLKKISTGLFPYLSTLQIADDQVGDSALRAICSGFKDLEKLKVCQGSSLRRKVCEVTDYGITGIAREKLKNYSAGDEVPDEVRADCWIGRLQKLRHIDLGEMTKCDGMTDISIQLGLATLPSLQELVMPANTKVSSAALNSLKVGFLNHRWRGKKSPFVDDNNIRISDVPGLSNSVGSDAVARVLNLQF